MTKEDIKVVSVFLTTESGDRYSYIRASQDDRDIIRKIEADLKGELCYVDDWEIVTLGDVKKGEIEAYLKESISSARKENEEWN